MNSNMALFSAAFFPSVQYFAHLFAFREAWFEAYEHYQKKTARNRYLICAANGILPLSVPVENTQQSKLHIKDVRVAYHTAWNEVHWRSIESAYNSSPYYLYYEDEIHTIFNNKWNSLFDMNIASIQAIFNCLDISFTIKQTTGYIPEGACSCDFRSLVNLRQTPAMQPQLPVIEYRQVFSSKFGFIPNLSILDLLFNKGPETALILKITQLHIGEKK